jgi:hypothetical protein
MQGGQLYVSYRQLKLAIGSFFKMLPSWFGTRYLWGFMIAPPVCMAAIYQLAAADVWGWQTAGTLKATMEIIHPSILGAGALIGIGGWALTRNQSTAFVGIMCAFAFFRELGGQGTSIVLYLGLIALIVYAQLNSHKLVTLVASRLATSAMATGFICYAISQLLDRGVIKRIGWLFTWDTSWKPPYSSQIEESLETLGGLCLLLTVLLVLVFALRASGETADQREDRADSS